MEKPNFKNIDYQWKSQEELAEEFLAKGWIKTKDRWVSPNELRNSGIAIKDGRILIPTKEIKPAKGRPYRVVAQKYLDFIGCGRICHEKNNEANDQNDVEKYPEI